MNNATHYEILGVEKTASAEAIKRAYREAARKYHPDANEVANASLIFRMINDAYEVLSNPAKRKEYDQSLDTPNAHKPPPPAPREHTSSAHHQPHHTTHYTTHNHYYAADDEYTPVVKKVRRKLPFPLSWIWAIVRTLLKIIFVPGLSIVVYFFTASTGFITLVSYIISGILSLGVVVWWWNAVTADAPIDWFMGIGGTIGIYIISPYGLPRLMFWSIDKIENFRLFIKNL